MKIKMKNDEKFLYHIIVRQYVAVVRVRTFYFDNKNMESHFKFIKLKRKMFYLNFMAFLLATPLHSAIISLTSYFII